MLSIGNYKNRRKLKIDVCGKLVSLLPPKVKDMKKIIEAAKKLQKESDIDEITKISELILNSNDEGRTYERSWIESKITVEELILLIRCYTNWIREIQNDPNSKSLTAMKQIAARD